MRKERGGTYEVSNLGVVRLPENPGGRSVLRLEKLVFTQCGMVTGPAIGVGVVSLVSVIYFVYFFPVLAMCHLFLPTYVTPVGT